MIKTKMYSLKNRSKNIVVFAVLMLFGFLSMVFPQKTEISTSPLPVELELNSQTFYPGDVVRITFPDRDEIVDFLQLTFLNRKFPMIKLEGTQTYLGLIGLDLALAPGNYDLTVTLLDRQRTQVSQKVNIVVLPKEFPSQRLWVDEKFVTPPAESLERITRESELLNAVYGMFTPMWLGEGNFIIPSEGLLSPNFGERRIFNNQPRSPHSGIDISSPFGAEVKASNSGSVVVANDLYYSGKTVVIDHGLGMFSLYCHFSEILVRIGEQVSRGKVIGKVGATGRVTGPHLHWAFRISGTRVDPLSIIDLEFPEGSRNEK